MRRLAGGEAVELAAGPAGALREGPGAVDQRFHEGVPPSASSPWTAGAGGRIGAVVVGTGPGPLTGRRARQGRAPMTVGDLPVT
ncbi:hypothetical protein GCM10018781_62270 [Kitasatospora indigofera]|uniref:Uncharacterized protein n=1 Tax=Kitasatospora indigofera TaxID=67307 RepID=A0A919GBH5_9ACTN|nr:hypothetical protein GCM10018781_62270 [Kitasatospora indigofera]